MHESHPQMGFIYVCIFFQLRAKGVGNVELSNQAIGSVFEGIHLEVEGGHGSDYLNVCLKVGGIRFFFWSG